MEKYRDIIYILLLILLVAIIIISFKMYDDWKYAEKDITYELEGVLYDKVTDEVTESSVITFSGIKQLHENTADVPFIVGQFALNGEEYPVNQLVDRPYARLYLYNIDGSYFGTMLLYPEFEKIIIYFTEAPTDDVKDCGSFLVFSINGEQDAEEIAKNLEI